MNLEINNKWRHNIKAKPLFDTLSLIVVMQYVAYRYLQSTVFPFVFTNLYKYITISSLAIIGGIRFCYIFRKEYLLWDTAKRFKEIVIFFLVAFLALPFLYVGWKHDYKVLVFYPLTALCFYNLDYRKVLRWFSWTIWILLTSTVICCLSGAIKNLTYGENGQLWGAYGIINTTDFAAYFTYLILIAWCKGNEKSIISRLCFFLVACTLSCIVFYLTDSRTGLLCGALTCIVVLLEPLYNNQINNKKRFVFIQKTTWGTTIFSFSFFAIVFFVLVIFYSWRVDSWQYSFAWKVEHLLSGRLSTTLNVYNQYGIKLFGTTTPILHGNGGSVVHNWSSGYGYLDSAYAMLLIRYGVVIFLIIMVFWMWTTNKAIRNGKVRIALSMAIIAFHAVSEARFLDVNYNIFLVMPFCSFGITNEQAVRITDKCGNETKCRIVSAIIIGIGLWALLPRMFSILRTLYSINGWNSGINTYKALLVSILLVGIVVGFWKGISLILHHRSKRSIALLSLEIIMLTLMLFVGEREIQKGLAQRQEGILAEKETVELLQDVALQPVYVAEGSEFYQRSIGGFSEHVFSTDELYRSKGTIITDSSTEALGILNLGGMYTQISELSSIYSFDQGVIEALESKGYVVEPFYYTERVCNLEDLAYRNGLKTENGKIIISGHNNSIYDSLEWDQYSGTYEVRFSLELGEEISQEEICTVRVLGEAKERVIVETSITKDMFDEQGYCVMTLSYDTQDVPMVSFQVEAEDEVEILLEEIAWKRVM